MPLIVMNGVTANVRADKVQKYLDKGARYAPPEEEGLQDPGLMDPLNYIGTPNLAGAVRVAPRVIRGIGGAMANRSAPRVAPALGSAAGRVADAFGPGSLGEDAVTLAGGEQGRAGLRMVNRLRGLFGQRGPAGPALEGMETLGAGVAQRAGSAASRVPAQAARALPQVAESAPAVATATEAVEAAAPKGLDRLATIGKPRKNASMQSQLQRAVEVEKALKESGLDAAGKKNIREALRAATPAPKGSAASRVGKVVGEIKPKPKASGSAAERVAAKQGKVVGEVGEKEPTLLAKPRPEGWDKPLSRHPHGYFSESKGAKVAIETMSQNHIINSIAKRSRELAKFGDRAAKRSPQKWSELQALKKELEWRSQFGGMEIQGKLAQ